MSDTNGKKRKSLTDLLNQVGNTHRRLVETKHRYSFYKGNTPKEYLIYRTPISKVQSLPNEALRYRAVAMCEPEIMPGDIELFIEMELDRIGKESLEH